MQPSCTWSPCECIGRKAQEEKQEQVQILNVVLRDACASKNRDQMRNTKMQRDVRLLAYRLTNSWVRQLMINTDNTWLVIGGKARARWQKQNWIKQCGLEDKDMFSRISTQMLRKWYNVSSGKTKISRMTNTSVNF